MVVFNVKSQFVTLFITVVTALAELAFTAAVLSINSHRLSRKLKNGHPIRIRKQQTTITLIVAACLGMFVIIELAVGANIHDQQLLTPSSQPCVQMGVNNGEQFSSFEQPIRSYLAQTFCTRVDDLQVQIALSNFSVSSTDVSCERSAIYEFHLGAPPRRNTQHATRYCADDGRGAQQCIFTSLLNNSLSFTAPVFEQHSAVHQMEFFDVQLHFEPPAQNVVSERLLQALLFDSASEVDAVVSSVFLGSRSSTCTFFQTQNGTRVPIAVICVLVAIWIGSFALFIGAACHAKRILLDLCEARDWAKVTLPCERRTHVKVEEALVCAVVDNGVRRLFVQLLPQLEDSN